jgi:hypothetical protein
VPLSMKNASDLIPSHRRCPESVHAKTGKDAPLAVIVPTRWRHA